MLHCLSIYVGLFVLAKNQWSSLPAGQIFGVIFTKRGYAQIAGSGEPCLGLFRLLFVGSFYVVLMLFSALE